MAKKRNSPGLNCSTALIILPKLACGQALHWGELREVTQEQHTKGDTSARDSLLRSLIHFHSHPRKRRKQQSMKTVTLVFQEQNITILHKEKTPKRK